MVNPNIKGVFYLASRCKRVCDAHSEIPGTRSIIEFFLRNAILPNPLTLFSRVNHPTTQELQQEQIQRVYSLTSDIFSSQDQARKGGSSSV